jgi:hypothetical protein
MKSILIIITTFLFSGAAFAQLTGQKSIPGDFASISMAIDSLNAEGVGAGGVTFNIAAGHMETFPAASSGLITATGSATDPVIFRKSGEGNNPIITNFGTAPGTTDYIICFQGCDYVTFDGIDLSDPSGVAEWGYAILKASPINGSQNITIKNSSITLKKTNTATYGIYSNNHTPASATLLTVTAAAGQNADNKFYGNTISNSYGGIYINGFADPAAPYSYYDHGNDIGSISGNSFTNFGGGTTICYQVYMAYQNNFTIANCDINGGTGSTGATYGIYGGAAVNATGSIYGNTIQLNTSGTTASVYGIYNSGLGTAGSTNALNIYNNTVQNCTQPASTTASFYGIYNLATAFTINLNGNLVNNNVLGGSYYMYLCYTTSLNGGTSNIFNNTVSNNQRSGVGTQLNQTYIYCIYAAGSGGISIHDNQVYGNSSPSQVLWSAFIYGIYCSNAAASQVVYNNTIHDQSIGSAYTAGHAMYGIYSSPASAGTATNAVYNNTIYNLSVNITSTGYGYIYGIYGYNTGNIYSNNIYNINVTSTSGYGYGTGIYQGGTGTFHVYKNKIYGVNMAGSAGYYHGIYITGSTLTNVYNNFISNLKTPSATNTTGLHGIYINSGTNVNLFYNTVFLNCASTSTGIFVSDAVYASTTAGVELRNNILVNTSAAQGSTTYSAAVYRRSNNTITSYSAASNNNDFYAGTPSANNLVYSDGTNNMQTLESFITLVSPRETGSVSEMPPFSNITTTPYDLHLNPTVSTKCESAGLAIATPPLTTDIDNEARYPNPGYPSNPSFPPNNPDIGADEFAGIPDDVTAPNIAFTPLENVLNGQERTLIATISDGTGVPVSGIGLPTLYWKINMGSWNPVQAIHTGGNQYLFTFGAGTVPYDYISYYIVAQDLVLPTPNAGSNPIPGASGFTNNPPACSTPPAIPYSYLYLGDISGEFHVGVGKDYQTLTHAVNDLHLKNMAGPVTFIMDDASYPNETIPIVIYPNPGNSSTNTLTIKPNTGQVTTITGYTTSGVLGLSGIDYVTIDGSNCGGTDRSLTIENTHPNSNTHAVGIYNYLNTNPATNCTIKNCVIMASPQIGNNTYGILFGSAGGGYENMVISNNHILRAKYGILFTGTSANKSNNGQILNNTIGSTVNNNSIQYRGITLEHAENTLISGNEIMGMPDGNSTSNKAGIFISAGSTNTKIRKNIIHDFYYSGNLGYAAYGIYYNAEATSLTEISNNIIYGIKGDGDPANLDYCPSGIYLSTGGNCKIYYNSINMTGATLSPSYLSYSACVSIGPAVAALDIRDNIFTNSMTPVSGNGNKTYAIYSAAPSGSINQIDYNNYFVDGINPNVGHLESDRNTLADWQAATGKDFNSIGANPLFIRPGNLRLSLGSPCIAAGTPIPGITTDYLNLPRSETTPTIGAYETGMTLPVPLIAYSSLNNATSGDARILTATITDTLGIPVSGIGLPMLYWRLGSSAWYNITGEYTAPGNYSFTFGAGASLGDTVLYYIVAQDMFTVPGLACSPAEGASGLTPNPPAAGVPPLIPNSYLIKNLIADTITIGTGGMYPSLTCNGGLFEAINNGIFYENVTAIVISDLTEDGTHALNPWEEEPVNAGFSLTIQPDGTTERVISGSTGSPMIHLNGANRVTFDGRYGGSGKYLRFHKTGESFPVFLFSNDATNNIIRNCFIGGTNPGPDGVICFSGTTGTTGNDDNILADNVISNIAGASVVPATLVYSQGTPGSENSGISITGNEFLNFSHAGIHVTNIGNGNSWNIVNNSFYNTLTSPPSTNQYGILFTPGNSSVADTISGNFIGGRSALCGGDSWVNSGDTITFHGLHFSVGTTTGTEIQGNKVRNITLTGTGSGNFSGIYGSGGLVNIGTTTANIIGSTTTEGNIVVEGTGSTAGITIMNCDASINHNTIANITQTSSTSPGRFTGINLVISEYHPLNVNANQISQCGPTSASPGLSDVTGICFSGSGSSMGPVNLSNNLISLGYGITNNHAYHGIDDNGYDGDMLNLYFNSIIIGGTSNGETDTYAFRKRNLVYETHYNNIYYNSRTGGTGRHVAIGCATMIDDFYSNHNDFFAQSGILGIWNAAEINNLSEWQAVSGQDINSVSADPGYSSPLNLIPTNLALNNTGVAIGGYPKDFAGSTRTNPPDMGAFEFGINPVITTTAASAIGTGSAVLNATINASGFTVGCWFDFGLTTEYGTSIASNPGQVSGNNDTLVNLLVLSLSSNTLYHYRARVITNEGVEVYGNDLTFTTLVNPFCTPVYSYGCGYGDGLNNIRMSLINVNNPCSGTPSYYHDYTGLTMDVLTGVPETLTMQAGYDKTHLRVWVDFNDNFTFESSEIVISDFLCATANLLYTTNITIAAGKPAGLHRIRFRTNYQAICTDPCSQYPYGNCSDFMLNVMTAPVVPDVETLEATGISSTVATLNGIVNPKGHATEVSFDFGTTSAYGTVYTVQSLLNGNGPTPVHYQVSDLVPGITYHYRIHGLSATADSVGEDKSFFTPPSAPGAFTNAATRIKPDSARLNGTVMANGRNTSIYFEYGLSSDYGGTVIGTPDSIESTLHDPVNTFADISGLVFNTTYHYRVVAISNSDTTFGIDRTFKTGVLFLETFSSGSFSTSNWTFSGGSNWSISHDLGNQVPSAQFSWTPVITGEQSMISPEIQGLNTTHLTLSYDITLDGYNTSIVGYMAVEIWDGLNWITLKTDSTSAGNFSWRSNEVDLTPYTNTSFNIRFRAYFNAYNVDFTTRWAIDNVKINTLPPVHPTVTGNNNPCQGATGNLYMTEAGKSNYTWMISPGGTTVSGGGSADTTVTVDWPEGGAQWVKVNYEDSLGSSGVNPGIIDVDVTHTPVPYINGPGSFCLNETENMYVTEPGMINYSWAVSPDGIIIGRSDTNTLHVKWNTMGEKLLTINYETPNHCHTPYTYGTNVVVFPTSSVVAASLQSATDTAGLWSPMNGSLTDGYDMCLYSKNPYYYFDINSLVSGTPLFPGDFTQNGFTLSTSSLPPSWNAYWAEKGVDTNALPDTWQYEMYQIITGNQPMFYLRYQGGSDYDLIDGLLFQTDSTIAPLRFSGDYPAWNYHYSGTVLDENLCRTDTTVITLTFNQLPIPTLSGPAVVCPGSEGNIYQSKPGMSDYSWDISAGGSVTAGGGLADATLIVDWNQPGLQWVTVNYKNNNGCMAEAPTIYQVTVTPAFTAGIAEADQEICSGTIPALLMATLPAGGIQLSGFQWQSSIDNLTFSNIPAATDQNYQPDALTINTYFRQVQVSPEGCGFVTNAVSVLLVQAPPAEKFVSSDTIQPGEQFCADASQTLTVGGSGSAFVVQAGGSAHLMAGQNIHILPETGVQPGGYLHGFIANECPWCNAFSNTQMVAARPDTLKTEKSLTDIPGIYKETSFSVYPNPTSGTITLELSTPPGEIPVKVKIFNMMGAEIMTMEFVEGNLHVFTLFEQKPGMYLIQVLRNNKPEFRKIIKY